jgi:CheY-like chemotaxis protein
MDDGYLVTQANTRQEARDAMKNRKIDLAIMDMRLNDDRDENDYSGLELAAERPFRHIPKIILTAYSTTYEQQRKVWEIIGGEPPAVIAFVGKSEEPDTLLQEISRAFEIWPRLSHLASPVTDRINSDHDEVRKQARLNYWISTVLSIFGFLIVVSGIVMAGVGKSIEIGIVGTASGLILEALGYLFFRQLESSNRRMDISHQQLLQTYGVEFLLAIAGRLPAEQENSSVEQIINAVLNSWYPAGVKPETFSIVKTDSNGTKRDGLSQALNTITTMAQKE